MSDFPVCQPLVAHPSPGVSFAVRPFPPDNLVNVPLNFIVTSLNKFASHYWAKPQTADCTITVPFGLDPKNRSRSRSDPAFPAVSITRPRDKQPLTPDDVLQGPLFSTTTSSLKSKEATNRRSSASTAEEGTRKRLVVKLHRDYLVCQSSLLHTLFTSTSPVDLTSMKHTSKLAAGAFPIPAAAQPRLLPCAPNHPHLYLPLPDPSSFPHIIHYLYFGKMNYIESCLCRGSITWEGIVRNVEYLGLRNPIKVFLGKWWAEWLDPTREAKSLRTRDSIIEEESESEEDDGDSDAEPSSYYIQAKNHQNVKQSPSTAPSIAA